MVAESIPLCTIGYEGRTPDGLVAVLRESDVQRVVDVRRLPLSRKRGFSKTALAETLKARGIEYVGLRELGTPMDALREYRETGDFDALTRRYLAHVAGADESVARLYDMAVAERCCLLCFEREAAQCHRSLLAAEVAKRNGRRFEVRHI